MNPRQFGYPYDLRFDAPPTPVIIKDKNGGIIRVLRAEISETDRRKSPYVKGKPTK